MKKQELIHLHSLLAEIASYCHEQGEALDLSSYETHDTHPMAISDAKANHEAAVLALAGGIATSLESPTDEGEPVTASAD